MGPLWAPLPLPPLLSLPRLPLPRTVILLESCFYHRKACTISIFMSLIVLIHGHMCCM